MGMERGHLTREQPVGSGCSQGEAPHTSLANGEDGTEYLKQGKYTLTPGGREGLLRLCLSPCPSPLSESEDENIVKGTE